MQLIRGCVGAAFGRKWSNGIILGRLRLLVCKKSNNFVFWYVSCASVEEETGISQYPGSAGDGRSSDGGGQVLWSDKKKRVSGDDEI